MKLSQQQMELIRARIESDVRDLNASLSEAYRYGLRAEIVSTGETPSVYIRLMNPVELEAADG